MRLREEVREHLPSGGGVQISVLVYVLRGRGTECDHSASLEKLFLVHVPVGEEELAGVGNEVGRLRRGVADQFDILLISKHELEVALFSPWR